MNKTYFCRATVKKKRSLSVIIFIMILTCFNLENIRAGTIEIDMPGLSYHIGANSEHPAYLLAPLKLDQNGAFVYNPGLGIGYDFKKEANTSGFSGIAKFIYFHDCNFKPFFICGGGLRYRYMLSKKFSGDIDLSCALIAGQKWKTSKYNFFVLPFPAIRFSYHFDNKPTVGFSFTISPKSKLASAVGGFWIIFLMLNASFPISGTETK